MVATLFTLPMVATLFTHPMVATLFTHPMVATLFTHPMVATLFTHPMVATLFTHPMVANLLFIFIPTVYSTRNCAVLYTSVLLLVCMSPILYNLQYINATQYFD